MLKKIQFLLLFLLVTHYVAGQSSPVQINTQVIPPAPIYFADYANKNVSNSPLRVQLLLRDVTLSNVEVRLKVSFSGNSISFQSNDNVIGAAPIFLEGGNPVVLQSVDLAPYFEYQNITGVAPSAYGNELTEGSYQICFEVFEALTNRRLSQKSCVTTYIFKNNPPILIAPANRSNVTERDPQNIVFQWTPRSINVSNVEYELSLVEVWDKQVDPQTAFLTTPPIFQVTTNATSFVYDSSQPLLLPDKKYAWRIQAKAKQGTENIGLFKNRGYSEIFSFSYATPCEPPLAINGEPKGANQANISWEDIDTNIPTFKVRYRKKGNTKWFFAETTSNWLTLWDLKADTTYEYQISKLCSVFDSNWSLLQTVTTQTTSEANDIKQCGIPPNINLDNTEPLPSIKANDGFKAGDFDVKILEVTGSDGRFTGKGFIRIPYLNSIKVGVEFTNILINTDKQLAEGMVITTYDITAGNIIDIDEAIDTVTDVVDAVDEVFEGENDLKDVKVDFVINSTDDIKKVGNEIVITNPATGETESFPANDDAVITDKAGNTYHIDEQTGKVTKGGQVDYTNGSVVSAESGNMVGVQRDGDLEKLTAPNIITFESANGPYGFDKIPEEKEAKKALAKQYETVKDTYGKDYTLVHQAVAKGATTKIIASIDVKNSEYKAKDVIFKTKQGEKLEAKVKSEKEIEVTLTGRYTFEYETIYAVVNSKVDTTKQLTAGAFTLWHLTPRTVNVKIVPVGNPSISSADIKTVENIFAKGIATVNIKKLDTISLHKKVLGTDKKLEIGDSAWLSAYNQEQKDVIADLKSKIPNFDNNAYYVFVFDDKTKTTKDIAGFMPLQRQFGFVFAGKTNAEEEGKNSLGGVLAHELGHGIFALQHPFTKYKTPKGDTNWLMDYGDGTALSHLDWKQIHDPALKFYIFQKEEDGEMSSALSYDFTTNNIIDDIYVEEKLSLNVLPSNSNLNVFDYEGVLSSNFENYLSNYLIGGKYSIRVITYNSQLDILKAIESLKPLPNEVLLLIKKGTSKSFVKVLLGENVLKELNDKSISKKDLIALIKDESTVDLKESLLNKQINQNIFSYYLVEHAKEYDGNIQAFIFITLLDSFISGIEDFKLADNVWDVSKSTYSPIIKGDKLRNAYVCGLYNGLIQEAKAIPELAKLLIKISSSEKNRKQFSSEIDKLIEQGVLNSILEALKKKYTNKPLYYLSYEAGKTTIAIGTMFVSFGSVTKAGKITNLVKLTNPLKGAVGFLNKITKAGLVIYKKSKNVFLLKSSLESSIILAKLDVDNILTEIKWLNEGNTISYLDNVKYLDESGNIIDAQLAYVKNADGELGFKLANGVDDALSKLLKNTDYKKFYDDLASGATPRRFANELTIQEEAVLKFYTNESYYNFNQALINGSKADEILEVEKLLNNTLDKIPSSADTYYRGIGKIEIEKLLKLKQGESIKYDNFLSTSSDRSYAGTFARKNMEKTNEAAIIIIESKNGKSIKKYSDLAKEEEFLHKSGSEFILKGVEDNKLLNAFEHQYEYRPAVYGKVFTLIEK